MTKIIDFQAAARRASDETLMETINRIIAKRLAKTAESFPETLCQRASRKKRNPYRKHEEGSD